MKTKTLKKIALKFFVISQIFFLFFGSVLPTYAAKSSWAALRYNLDDDKIPSGVKDSSEYDETETYKGNDQAPRVSITFTPANPKPGDKVTATAMAAPFSTDTKDLYYTWFLKRKDCDLSVKDPNGGKKATDSESYDPNASYPSHEELSKVLEDGQKTSQYECDSDLDGLITVNDWKVDAMRIVAQNGFKPDLGGRYETLDNFYAEETDEDAYQTFQGGADAERMPAHCYAYDATAGMFFEFLDKYLKSVPMCPNPNKIGGTKNKIPAICGKDVEAEVVDVDGKEDPCFCSEDIDGSGTRDSIGCPDCLDGGYVDGGNQSGVNPRAYLSNLYPTLASRSGEATTGLLGATTTDWTPPAGGINPPDGYVQWWECLIDGGFGSYCDVPAGTAYWDGVGGTNPAWPETAHSDCEKRPSFGVCEKQATAPRCSKIEKGDGKGKFAAVCGEDKDKDGIDDNNKQGRAICPTEGYYQIGADDNFYDITQADFNDAISGGITFQDDYYLDSREGKYAPFDELPACNCTKAGTMMNPSREDPTIEPYIGSSRNPLCEDESPKIDDLLCGSITFNYGSGTNVNTKDQFHIFPKKLPVDSNTGKVSKNYYDLTRKYLKRNSNDKFQYLVKDVETVGDAKFKLDEERFWETDPRNPSTAGNGKSDEANVAGLGAEKFTWVYEEGDQLGVGVEGTSNLGTKFPDSSRMVMWAFSKGIEGVTNADDEADIACQPKYSGWYPVNDWVNAQNVAFLTIPKYLQMPTGFMDFDRCVEKSIVPVIVGDENKGAQPKMMEVELSATPAKPLNDENDEGQGDTITVLPVITGAENPENNLNYSWQVQIFKPKTDPTTKLSVAPAQSDWEKAETICGEKITSVELLERCVLKTGEGGKIKVGGMGLSEFSFNLNISKKADSPTAALYDKLFNDNGEGYFRISVTVRENNDKASPPNSRIGMGEVVIKVTTNENRINIFRPTVSGDKLSSPGTPFCELGADRNPCLVTKNEIIGLSIEGSTIFDKIKGEGLTDFNWTLNDNPINDCDKSMSDDCDDFKGARVTYIPVVGNVGEVFTVKINASSVSGGTEGQNTSAIGKKLELVQQFQVVEPSISIAPIGDATKGEGAWRKVLGKFSDPTGVEADQEDLSQFILETRAGNEAEFELNYSPSYLNGIVTNETWQIDGGIVSAPPKLTAGPLGTVHNVSASADYAQTTEVYRMLKQKFQINPSEMVSRKISHSVQVEVNQDVKPTAMGSPIRFAANLLSKVPEQILFLFRLMLSVALVVVITGVIFAFFPETNYDKRRVM